MRACGIVGLALAIGIGAASAQEMRSPRISPVRADWDALAQELQAIEEAQVNQSRPQGSLGERLTADGFRRVNSATGERFANIAASPVPVLLPFNTLAFLRDRADGAARDDAENYLSGFNSVTFFHAGTGGYDAVVLARAQDMPELDIGFSNPIYIHIGGAALLYELDEPNGMIAWPVTALDEFPGLRRIFLENYVRYIFVRYGVSYALAIECFDGPSRFRKISCRDADKVAIRALKALHFVGGTPQERVEQVGSATIDRPQSESSVFTYYPPGNLVPRSGFRGKGGVADRTVYSRIRFPLADAPAFANSQSFTRWTDCDANNGAARGAIGAYRCGEAAQPQARSEAANYSYPWRDNFCESRAFYVGQCPGGRGHQGQDLRPASCKQRSPGAHCEPGVHDLVAVRDGAVLRAAGQESLFLVVNAPNERIRFRYLHMSPRQLDTEGMVSGRLVREGEAIGKVGNFYRREAGTFAHLHFDVQVPTKYGWVFVNPYMTLVAAYERLIHGRGQEIRDDTGPDVPIGLLPTQPIVPLSVQAPADLRAAARAFARARPRAWHIRHGSHASDDQR